MACSICLDGMSTHCKAVVALHIVQDVSVQCPAVPYVPHHQTRSNSSNPDERREGPRLDQSSDWLSRYILQVFYLSHRPK